MAGSLDDLFQPLILVGRKHKRCFVSTSRRWGALQPPNLPPANRARCTPPMWDPFEPENLTRNVIATPGCSPIQHSSGCLFVQLSAAEHNQCNAGRATGSKDMRVISGCAERMGCPQGVLLEPHSALFKLPGILSGSHKPSSLPSTCKTFKLSHFHPFGAAASVQWECPSPDSAASLGSCLLNRLYLGPKR